VSGDGEDDELACWKRGESELSELNLKKLAK